MYEVVWDTTPFNDKNLWPTDGSQPFYFSYGDNTGYGQHGDYVFGWQGNELQIGMDATNCMGAKCKTMANQNIQKAKSCAVKNVVKEDHDACKSHFCSFAPLSFGHKMLGIKTLLI
jgi:hypothetical protein